MGAALSWLWTRHPSWPRLDIPFGKILFQFNSYPWSCRQHLLLSSRLWHWPSYSCSSNRPAEASPE